MRSPAAKRVVAAGRRTFRRASSQRSPDGRSPPMVQNPTKTPARRAGPGEEAERAQAEAEAPTIH